MPDTVHAVTDRAIALDDPRAEDVRALLGRHLALAHVHTPPGESYAFDAEALRDPAVSFFSYRVDGELLGVAALKRLDAEHAEIKSMHTAEAARRRGVGRALVDHLIALARARCYRRVSLATGAGPELVGESVVRGSGLHACAPFADYEESPNVVCMALWLHGFSRRDDGSDGTRTRDLRRDRPAL